MADSVACYMRVSTTDQDTASQRAEMDAWIARHGHEAVWYIDNGESSVATERPAFQRMMNAIRSGRHRTILCWNIDRINRWSVKEHLAWRLELDRLGVSVVSITQPMAASFDSFMDLIRELVEAEGRRCWIETHIQRVRAGIAARRARGLRVGGVPKKRSPEYWAMISDAAKKIRSCRSVAKSTGVPLSTVLLHVRSAKANPEWITSRIGAA